jgi:NTP pyrophosphatase (non-canonical NTP hydrolase)
LEKEAKEVLNNYRQFVMGLTSDQSKFTAEMINSMITIQKAGGNPSLLMTSAIGMCCESGEYSEIVKKIFFQGKPYNEDNIYHMKRELGDAIFYWMMACTALGLDPVEVIKENVSKLEGRYPGGKFDPFHSENRKEGDL